MKKFLFFLLAVTFGFVAQAQDKAEIKFVTEEIDYGTIKQGADGVRVFEFKNTGKAPLVISGASSSCGCTVKYDTTRVGQIAKTILVNSNAKDTPTVALRIKGKVE